MTKMEMLEKLRKQARIEPVTPGIADIVIRIYFEDDDYDEFLRWIDGKNEESEPWEQTGARKR